MKHPSTLLVLALLASVPSNAQPGYLDDSFNGNGILVYDGISDFCSGGDVAVRPDGKIWALGSAHLTDHYSILLLRFNIDGTADNTFSDDGVETYSIGSGDAKGYALHLYANGDLLIGGSVGDSCLLAKVDENGNLVPSFGDQGILYIPNFQGVAGHITDLGFQSDGTIVYTASGDGAIIGTVSPEGTLIYNADYSLGSTGTELDGVLVLPDDRVMATGTVYPANQEPPFGEHRVLVMRFSQAMTPDMGFGSIEWNQQQQWGAIAIVPDGTFDSETQDFGKDMALSADGHVLVGGGYYSSSGGRFLLMELNEDGTIVSGFNMGAADSSSIIGNHIETIAVLADGKIVASGLDPAQHCIVARFNPDGTPDSDFGHNNGVYPGWTAVALDGSENTLSGMALMPDGRIMVTGTIYDSGNQLALARFNNLAIGVDESTAPETGVQIFPNPGTDLVHIETGLKGPTEVRVLDATGRTVLKATSESSSMALGCANLSPDLYLVEVRTPEGRQTARWMKQ